jgi:hypothetical protein
LKHLALRARSVHGDRPFTAAGLGDRIHSATLAWAYGQGEPVTLHLTAEHIAGGQFGNKPESWAEIAELFPAGMVTICPHQFVPKTEGEWSDYLGLEAYRYGDHPGPREPIGFDIAPFLRNFPRLTAQAQDVSLPQRFFTAQWDAGGAGRRVKPTVIPGITVVVGGQAEGNLRWSLKHIAWAMTQSDGHHGVDSAFFHLAQLYLTPERITLYHRDAMSHHARRARAAGVQCVRL